MANITWTNTFTTNQHGNIFSKIQQNFNDGLTVLNGNIDGSNISTDSVISTNSITVSSALDATILENTNLAIDMVLEFGAGGTKKLMITDSADTSLFEVDIDGNITVPIGKTNLYPIGTIVYYTGAWTNNSTIPGWYQCDGTNSTPNLTNLFIMGASSSGQTGGYTDLTLGTHSHASVVGANSADHTHTFTGTLVSATLGTHQHTLAFNDNGGNRGTPSVPYGGYHYLASHNTVGSSDTTHSHTVSFTSDADADTHIHTVVLANTGTGEDGVGDNIPAYYTLIPVMRVS
jgi:hypothetical protein